MNERDEVLSVCAAMREKAEGLTQAAQSWRPHPDGHRSAAVDLANMAAEFATLVESRLDGAAAHLSAQPRRVQGRLRSAS